MSCENGTCNGAYADANEFMTRFCQDIDEDYVSVLNSNLEIAAGDINISLQAQDMCDCTPSNGAMGFLKNLNLLLVAAYYTCPCAHFTAEDKRRMGEYATSLLTALRMGEVEVCDGYAGKEYPAWGTAEQGLTVFNKRDIIINRIKRQGG